jgi:hypothetical protein
MKNDEKDETYYKHKHPKRTQKEYEGNIGVGGDL